MVCSLGWSFPNENFPSVVCIRRQTGQHAWSTRVLEHEICTAGFLKRLFFLYTIAFSWPNAFKGALWKKDERFDGKHCGSSRDSAAKAKKWAEGSVVDFCNKLCLNDCFFQHRQCCPFLFIITWKKQAIIWMKWVLIVLDYYTVCLKSTLSRTFSHFYF